MMSIIDFSGVGTRGSLTPISASHVSAIGHECVEEIGVGTVQSGREGRSRRRQQKSDLGNLTTGAGKDSGSDDHTLIIILSPGKTGHHSPS